MKKLLLLFYSLALVLAGWYGYQFVNKYDNKLVVPEDFVKSRPLDRYNIIQLSQYQVLSSYITLVDIINDTADFAAYRFRFSSEGKKVTGLIHIPKSDPPEAGFPVIVQLRGWTPQETYESGTGTRRSAQVFAANGFITLAPDFLGYGGSDSEPDDAFESRFATYTTVLNLMASIATIPNADSSRVALWGHSNGGHIALTVLAITGENYPTSLWAPVTKPFPYSILYYSDEATDSGKYLRKILSDFESVYDVDFYTFTNYLDRIKAPMIIHQGTRDEAVPQRWTDDFIRKAKAQSISINYYLYPGAGHNLSGIDNDSWNLVVKRDIEFYRKELTLVKY